MLGLVDTAADPKGRGTDPSYNPLLLQASHHPPTVPPVASSRMPTVAAYLPLLDSAPSSGFVLCLLAALGWEETPSTGLLSLSTQVPLSLLL